MSNDHRGKAELDRRALLKVTALGAGLSAAPLLTAAPVLAKGEASKADAIMAGAGIAVADTAYGQVAGYVARGIYTFKGMPYGDDTAGDNRFMPPRKPKPWSGVRSSRQYGLVAPQDKGTGRLNDEEAFIFQWNDSVEGEDCLRLNVWTPGIANGGKRPVMVWLHGGGFTAGSGNDLPAFDGENLSRRGDVVVVTLNHRLNLLGFLDLSAYGDEYARSGNVGMLDIVAALEWVRDNIVNFGGDPDRVTIFGQSGGGGKVSTLMGMPSARGLFHRAIVESGSFSLGQSQENARRLAAMMLEELGLEGGHISAIRTIPYAELERASVAALARANTGGPLSDLRNIASRLGFGPVVDGTVLPRTPFAEVGPEMTADVPMIIGTTLNEFATGINHPEYEAMTEEELRRNVERLYPGRAEEVIAPFRERVPGAKPFDIWSRIASAPVRQAAIDQAAAKAALGQAPAYLYWFTWITDVLDGRPRAFHCAEIPFVFCNTDRCENMTGGGERPRALSDVMAGAWIAFARTGNPNHGGMPQWKPFTTAAGEVMIFDDDTRLERFPDKGEQMVIGTT